MKKCLIFFLVFLTGCATTGNESLKGMSEEDVAAIITVGETTKDQVQAIFGSPFQTSFTDGGALIWTFQYDDTSALTAETVGSVLLTMGIAGTKSRGVRSQLVVMFNEDDIVQRYNMSNSYIESGTILFGT